MVGKSSIVEKKTFPKCSDDDIYVVKWICYQLFFLMELGRYQQKQRFSSSLPNLTAVEFHHVYIQKWYTRRWCNCPKAVVGTNQVNRRKAATSKHSKGLQLNFWYLVISIIPAVESLTNGFFCDITNLWRLNHSTPMSWCGSIASRMIRKVSLQLADFKFRTTAEGPGIHGWTKILPRRFAVRSKKKKLQLWYLFCLLNLQITGLHKILQANRCRNRLFMDLSSSCNRHVNFV